METEKRTVDSRLSESEFIKIIKTKGWTFSRRQAMSGSQYWTINGRPYRFSDHLNPNKPSFTNPHTEVVFYEEIIKLEDISVAKSLEINTVDEMLYDRESDGFYVNPNYIFKP